MNTFRFPTRAVRTLLVVVIAILLAVMIQGRFFAGPVIAQEGGQGGTHRVITGMVVIGAGDTFTILEPEPGKAFFGHITARGTTLAGALVDTYDLQVPVQGANIHITGGPTHMPATKDQNASFVGEGLQAHNFGASPIVFRFAVVLSRRHLNE